MKPVSLTASSLRIILTIVLLLGLAGGGAGFYFVHGLLSGYAEETSTLNSQAAASEENIAALRSVQSYLKTHTDDIKRAQKVLAQSQRYQYQNEAINDIRRLAGKSGITVQSITFVGDSTTGGTTTAPQSTTPATGGTGAAQTVPGSTPSVAVKSKKFDVQIESPVNYRDLLKFVYLTEQNITRMQIGSIKLAKSTEGGKNSVTSDSFNIEVYVQ